MNERIFEIEIEARKFADQNEYGKYEVKIWRNVFTNKFAELIVRECLEQGNVLAKHYIDTHPEQEQAMLLASVADYSNAIKLQFGVIE